ncbi:MAG: glycosyltransferase family 2 protein [Myxococcota bacterium]
MGGVDLSVLILSWNTRELTLACLEALEREPPRRRREVIVVDNGSEDGSAEAVAERFPDVHLIANPDNRFYSGGNNQAAAVARGRYLCLLNSDTEVTPGALDTLVDWLEGHPEYAAASPKLLGFDGHVQPICNRLMGFLNPLVDSTSLGRFPPGSWVSNRTRMAHFDHLASRDVEQPCTSALVIRADDFRAIGGFDPALRVYFTDVDLCRRLAAQGRKIRYLANTAVHHHLGSSTRLSSERTRLWLADRQAYFRKHYGVPGEIWVRAVLRLYGAEMFARIWLGPRRGEARRAALRAVRDEVRSGLRRQPERVAPGVDYGPPVPPERG